jgi:hypothetical protein
MLDLLSDLRNLFSGEKDEDSQWRVQGFGVLDE